MNQSTNNSVKQNSKTAINDTKSVSANAQTTASNDFKNGISNLKNNWTKIKEDTIHNITTFGVLTLVIFLLSRSEKLPEIEFEDALWYTMKPCSDKKPATKLRGGTESFTDDIIKKGETNRKLFQNDSKTELMSRFTKKYCNTYTNDLTALEAFLFVFDGACLVSENGANKVLNVFIDLAQRPTMFKTKAFSGYIKSN